MTLYFLLLLVVGGVFIRFRIWYQGEQQGIEEIEGSVSWWEWRRWSLKRLYRQTRTRLLIRLLSSHIFAAKTVFTLSIVGAAVIWTSDNGNIILTGATVFYATALYLNNRFEYPAVYPIEVSVFEAVKENVMSDVNVNMTVINRGGITAEDISANMKIVDPTRNCSSLSVDASTEATLSDEEATAPLKSRRTREISFTLATNNDDLSRVRMDDRLGDEAWTEIEIDSPDQLTSTWVYEPLGRGKTVSVDTFTDALSLGIDNLSERIDELPETGSDEEIGLVDKENGENNGKSK